MKTLRDFLNEEEESFAPGDTYIYHHPTDKLYKVKHRTLNTANDFVQKNPTVFGLGADEYANFKRARSSDYRSNLRASEDKYRQTQVKINNQISIVHFHKLSGSVHIETRMPNKEIALRGSQNALRHLIKRDPSLEHATVQATSHCPAPEPRKSMYGLRHTDYFSHPPKFANEFLAESENDEPKKFNFEPWGVYVYHHPTQTFHHVGYYNISQEPPATPQHQEAITLHNIEQRFERWSTFPENSDKLGVPRDHDFHIPARSIGIQQDTSLLHLNNQGHALINTKDIRPGTGYWSKIHEVARAIRRQEPGIEHHLTFSHYSLGGRGPGGGNLGSWLESVDGLYKTKDSPSK